MKFERRDPVKSIIFSLFSCGIYQLYWTFFVVKESLTYTNKRGNIAFEIILSMLLPFLGLYLVERKFSEGCANQGIEHTDKSAIYLVLSIIPFGVLLALGFIQAELNKISEILES